MNIAGLFIWFDLSSAECNLIFLKDICNQLMNSRVDHVDTWAPALDRTYGNYEVIWNE